MIIGTPILIGFYFTISQFGEYWWFIFGLFIFLFSLLLGRLAPLLIFPLFYKFEPLDNESLKIQISDLCLNNNISIKGIYSFNFSKNTKKANAAFTGLGKAKRIIISDTLLDNFTEDEILSVFAHEPGHYKKKHILKLIALSFVLTFSGLYAVSVLYQYFVSISGYVNIQQISALPVLALLLSGYGLLTLPISNILSRRYEREADKFSLSVIKKADIYISVLEKLSKQNLSYKTPNKIVEFLFHSHPSIEKRIQNAAKYTYN
ncbi:MAG: hypothetical protein FJ216_02585 [Ignavibacteria bacterium]|nr:hypothetical protein [Ignavibacteria bacterium]